MLFAQKTENFDNSIVLRIVSLHTVSSSQRNYVTTDYIQDMKENLKEISVSNS